MRTQSNLFLVLPLLLGLSACTHHYYAPNPVYTPLLVNKNDAVVAVGFGSGDQFSSFDLHAAYSPIKYGAIMTNYFKAYSDRSKTDRGWGQGHLLEGALGGYYPITGGVVSVFAGYGKGNVFNQYSNGAGSKLYFSKFFVQPNLAYKISFFRLGIGLRMSNVYFRKADVDVRIGSIESDELTAIQNIEKASSFWLPELGINTGFDVKWVYLFAQLSFVNEAKASDYHFARSVLSFGCTVNLHSFWEKKQPNQ